MRGGTPSMRGSILVLLCSCVLELPLASTDDPSQSATTTMERALELRNIGREEEALGLYEALVARGGESESVLTALEAIAEVNHDLGEDQATVYAYRRVVAQAPQGRRAAAAWEKIGDYYVKRVEDLEALQKYTEAVESDALGEVAAPDPEQAATAALECFEEATKADPTFVTAHSKLGKQLLLAQGPKAAIPALAKAVKLAPDPPKDGDALFELGHALGKAGRFSKAEKVYRRTVEAEPGRDDAYMNLGVLYHERGRALEAADSYRKALEILPSAGVQYNLDMLLDHHPEFQGKEGNTGEQQQQQQQHCGGAYPWRCAELGDSPLTTFTRSLHYNSEGGVGFGLKYHKRTKRFDQPSEGDHLKASTVSFPVISEVAAGSSAEESGLRVGDVLLAVNGVSVSGNSPEQIEAETRPHGSGGADDSGGADGAEKKATTHFFHGLFWRRAPLWQPTEEEPTSPLVVTIVAFNRPQYLKRVTAALAAARGVEEATVLFFLEPANREVIRAARAFAASGRSKRSMVQVNPVIFGMPHNLRQAVEVGLTRSDFVVLLEDDIVVSPDALEYLNWARRRYADDPGVFSVSLYADIGRAENMAEPGDPDELAPSEWFAAARRDWFTPWGWGFWRDRFEPVAHVYTGYDNQMNMEYLGVALSNIGQEVEGSSGLRGNRSEIFPLLSRSNNIGVEGGIHHRTIPPKLARAGCFIEKNFAGDEALEAADRKREERRRRRGGGDAGGIVEVEGAVELFEEVTDPDVLQVLCSRCGRLGCGNLTKALALCSRAGRGRD